jgi:VWFA-related protein
MVIRLSALQGHRLKAIICFLSVLTSGWAIVFPASVPAAKVPVYVTASFADKRGLFIEDLSKEEVQIFENDQPRKIEFMARDEIPTVYGLIFDLSMLPEKPEDDYRGTTLIISNASAARSMAYELIDKHLGRQTIWVGGYEKELGIVQDFTIDGFSAKAAINQMHGKRGRSEPFLYSALFSGIMKMNTRTEKRRVIVVFMDLLDSDTADKLKPLKNVLSSMNVELFVVSFASRLGSGRGGLLSSASGSSLRELTQITSGEAFFTADYKDHYEDITRRLYSHIRTFYTLGFESEASTDKPFRLTIRCTRAGSRVKHHPTVAMLP